MKSESFKGSVTEYQGEPVNPAINYEGEAEIFENIAELKASEDFPSDSEILKLVNTKRRTAAKQGKYQEVTAELKKKYEASPAFVRKNFIAAAVAAGMSAEQAEALLASAR